jgi:nitroreductase
MTSPLRDAAELALAAPSIFNTQPWQWILWPDRLELRADRDRQLQAVDPDGRLLTISCGVALHHALISLPGTGVELTCLPDAGDPDLLATLRMSVEALGPPAHPELRKAIRVRRTDRRTYSGTPVAPEVISSLIRACEAQGAHLHMVDWHQIASMALAAVRAGAWQLSNPDYLAELEHWTHRPPWSGDGVPTGTTVTAVPRRVPVRDFAPFGGQTMPAGIDNDWGAAYAIVYTASDTPRDWLSAGMALSAVLLTATAAGLATAPISDVTEVTTAREEMRRMLSGGQPQVALRVGHATAGDPPSTPRRPANEVIVDAQ